MVPNQANRWIRTDPSRFRAGQVVQLEVAFRVVPTTAKGIYRMVPLIRSIALLDSGLYTVLVNSSHPYSLNDTNAYHDPDLAAENTVGENHHKLS